MTFNEKDEARLVEFLNFVATNAKFDGMDVKGIIEFHRLLSWSQQELLPKVKDNILEVKRVIDAPKEEKPKAAKAKKGKSK